MYEQVSLKLSKGRDPSKTSHLPDPPHATVALGRSVDAGQLTAGSDVYLTCHVDANPPVTRVTWFHEVGNLNIENVSWSL